MRKYLAVTAIFASLIAVPTSAFGTTPPADPNDVEAVNNPLDANDEEGFNDWGLLGLLGLAGLAGLKRRESVYRPDSDRITTR